MNAVFLDIEEDEDFAKGEGDDEQQTEWQVSAGMRPESELACRTVLPEIDEAYHWTTCRSLQYSRNKLDLADKWSTGLQSVSIDHSSLLNDLEFITPDRLNIRQCIWFGKGQSKTKTDFRKTKLHCCLICIHFTFLHYNSP